MYEAEPKLIPNNWANYWRFSGDNYKLYKPEVCRGIPGIQNSTKLYMSTINNEYIETAWSVPLKLKSIDLWFNKPKIDHTVVINHRVVSNPYPAALVGSSAIPASTITATAAPAGTATLYDTDELSIEYLDKYSENDIIGASTDLYYYTTRLKDYLLINKEFNDSKASAEGLNIHPNDRGESLLDIESQLKMYYDAKDIKFTVNINDIDSQIDEYILSLNEDHKLNKDQILRDLNDIRAEKGLTNLIIIPSTMEHFYEMVTAADNLEPIPGLSLQEPEVNINETIEANAKIAERRANQAERIAKDSKDTWSTVISLDSMDIRPEFLSTLEDRWRRA